jgi:hypothetical protein
MGARLTGLGIVPLVAAAALVPAAHGQAVPRPAVGPWAVAWGGYTAYALRAGTEAHPGGGTWRGAAAGVRVGRAAFLGVQAQGFEGWFTEDVTRGTSVGVLAGARLAAAHSAALLAYGGVSRERFRSNERFAGVGIEAGLALELAPRWAVSPVLLAGRRWWLSGEERGAAPGERRRVRAGQPYTLGLGVSLW